MRKQIVWILTMMLIMILAPGMAEEKVEELPESEGYRYRLLEDGTAEIAEYVGKEHFLTIPEKLDGYTVTSVGDEAFYHKPHSLAEIIIPDTVTHLGSMAFALSDLETVVIPESVVSMKDNPFAFCEYLETMTVAENNPAFYVENGVLFCREDRSLVCFPNMRADSEYTVPEGTLKIRGGAFGGVETLTEIHFPESLTEIGRQAFGFCFNLESATIPDSVTEIGEMAFDTCKSLESVRLPAGLTRISPMMFYECESLNGPEIPETVTEIGESAFSFCANLKEIRIPDSVTYIGADAFDDYGENLVITGSADSCAKTYCEENGIAFRAE